MRLLIYMLLNLVYCFCNRSITSLFFQTFQTSQNSISTGLCGANCYHWYDVFIPGVSVRNYTDEELQEMIDEENEKTSYDGKEYTTYEALQRQRKLELTMRVYRQDIKLMKEGGVSELEIMGAKARYKKTMDEYVKFSKVMKLPEQRDRIYMDGLGRISTKVGKKILSSMKISIPKEVAEKAGLDKSVEKKINQAIKKLDKEYTIYLDSIEGTGCIFHRSGLQYL